MKYLRKTELLVFFTAVGLFLSSCSNDSGTTANASANGDTAAVVEEEAPSADPMQNKGIGPITSVEIGPLDQAMADQGAEIFQAKCSSCHKTDERYIGPSIGGVTERRTPEWIMNMIMNPDEMVKKDPIAKELLAEYLAPMANQNISEDEARKIYEYFRTL